MRRVYRHTIPVDDQAHIFRLTGEVLMVSGGNTAMEFWVEDDDGAGRSDRAFQVFGTGQPLPETARYVGTSSRTSFGLVWHLYEIVAA